MNTFESLEGAKGENLATAGLRLLLLRSHSLRRTFLRDLSRALVEPDGAGELVAGGALTSESHFSCYTEQTAYHDDGQGRIDLVLEIDDAVIGIECKLQAAFGPGQPEAYVGELRRLAETLGKLRRSPVRPVLVVVFPEARRIEVSNKLRRIEFPTGMLSWEQIARAVQKASGVAEPFIAGLCAEYREFLTRRLEFLPDLDLWFPRLSMSMAAAAPHHRRFMSAVLEALPLAGRRVAAGDTYCGFGIVTDDSRSQAGWLGFVPCDRTGVAGPNTSSLVLAALRDLPLEVPTFVPIAMANGLSLRKSGGYIPATHHWVVSYDETWGNAAVVREQLMPALRAFGVVEG